MKRWIPVSVAIVVIFAACAGTPPAGRGQTDVYSGTGRGATLGEAINAAKMDAVRKAVIDLIGADAEATQSAKLNDVLYATRNPNAFVVNDSMETARRDGSLAEGNLLYEIRIRVDVQAVSRTLNSNGIRRFDAATGLDGGGGTTPSRSGSGSGAASQTSIPEPEYQNVTDAEQRFIARYVDSMTYMVYFAEGAAERLDEGDFVMRSAVNQANSYLVANGNIVIDAAQVEQLKQDHKLVYEEQVGQGLSLLQWIARRLNADVYIELDARLSGRTTGSSHYAIADVTMNMYETSTGQILGSINRRSQETFSRTSETDAAVNALQSSVYQAMPQAVQMARTQMERSLTRGIRYEVTLQRPPDARTLSRFRTAMRDEVRDIATVSQSPEEVLYEVFMIGSTDDLVDLVFSVSDRIAGLEKLTLVVSRGRAVTFDGGM